MTAISAIRLDRVCPLVFASPESRADIARSGIWDKDITFAKGGRYLIEAASGTGKSSLCSFIFGQRLDYTGTITFDGCDSRLFSINHWCHLRKLNIAYLPQEANLFPELTVMENIMIKNRLTGHKTPAQIMEMLEWFDLGWKASSPARLLSIGQQQRVAIIRALCQPFDFILADEPVSHLDLTNNRLAAELFDREAALNNAALIITSVGNRINLPDMEIIRL